MKKTWFLLLIIFLVMSTTVLATPVNKRINRSILTYYKMEDTSLGAQDELGNAFFKASGAFNWSHPGIIDNSIDGVAGFEMTNTSNTVYNLGTARFSINFWIYLTKTGQTQYLLGQFNTVPWHYAYVDNTNKMLWISYVNSGDRYYEYMTVPLNASTWYMITLTRNATRSYKIFINGKQRSTTTQNSGGTNFNYAQDDWAIFNSLGSADEYEGGLDEFSVYKTLVLNRTEMRYLYAAGAPTSEQQWPFANASAPPGGIDFQFTLNSPVNDSHTNTYLYLNFTIYSEISPWWNCTSFTNGTESGLVIDRNLNYTNNTDNSLLIWEPTVSENLTWYLKCTGDGGSLQNQTGIYNFVIDKESPEIISITPKQDGSTRLTNNETMTLNAWTNDTYLYYVNLSIYNSTMGLMYQNYTNISGTGIQNYTWNHTLNLTTWGVGTYYAFYQALDSHTDQKLKEKFNPEKDVEKKKLTYDTTKYYGNAIVDFYHKEGQCEVEYFYDTEKIDRHSPTYIFDCEDEHKETFVFHSSIPLKYLPETAPSYMGHLVGTRGMSGFWFDANIEGDPKAKYKIKEIDSYTYEIEITTNLTTLSFESLGGLNYNSLNISFKIQTNMTVFLNHSILGYLSDWVAVINGTTYNVSGTNRTIWVDPNTMHSVSGVKIPYTITTYYAYMNTSPLTVVINATNVTNGSWAKTFILIQERTGEGMDVSNASSVILYSDDNSTYYDFTVHGTNTVYYVGTGNTKLRFEIVYYDGTQITRYIDVNLINESTVRVCGNHDDVRHYEQDLVSSSIRPVSMLNQFAQCYIAADYTRFAYHDAYILKAYSIGSLYYLYTISNGAKSYLASIDGTIESNIDLNYLEFQQTSYNIGLLSDSLIINRNETTPDIIHIFYNNEAEDNTQVQILIYRTDNNSLVFNVTENATPNMFHIYFDTSLIPNVTNTTQFMIQLTRTLTDGTQETMKRYFSKFSALPGKYSGKAAILISILLVLFGITLVPQRMAISWFGILMMGSAMVVLALSDGGQWVIFFEAIYLICIVFSVFMMTNQNYGSMT